MEDVSTTLDPLALDTISLCKRMCESVEDVCCGVSFGTKISGLALDGPRILLLSCTFILGCAVFLRWGWMRSIIESCIYFFEKIKFSLYFHILYYYKLNAKSE